MTAETGHPGPRAGVMAHRTSDLPSTRVRGLPVTTVERTLSDLASDVRERARAEAEVRRLAPRGEDPPSLTRSEAERRLLSLLRRAGIPPDATNARLGRFEVDLLYRHPRLVIEVDGYAYHGHRLAFERDKVRDAELQAMGFRVLRVTWRQLMAEPEAVLVRVVRLLGLGRGPG